jgi:hypothetical protein
VSLKWSAATAAHLSVALPGSGQLYSGKTLAALERLSLEGARHLVEGYVVHYNNIRLDTALGYITPKDMLAGHHAEIHAEPDRKLEVAQTAASPSAAGCVNNAEAQSPDSRTAKEDGVWSFPPNG